MSVALEDYLFEIKKCWFKTS